MDAAAIKFNNLIFTAPKIGTYREKNQKTK